jgi:dTDP-4-amino-4,6-dideoxygalactose transaminase
VWIQKRLDISWRRLWTSLAFPSFILDAGGLDEKISSYMDGSSGSYSMTCLSVRTAFDLLLSAIEIAPGDEIIMTAVNIAHMFQIAADRGLKVVPVDISADTLAPDIESLKSLINQKTRAVVAAHLFGAKADLAPVRKVAKERGILFIEDSSQYFPGPGEELLSDVRFSSFGTIKSCTSLGGAIVSLRDEKLFAAMKKLHSYYPRQSEFSYKFKVLKAMLLKLISGRVVFGALTSLCAVFGVDVDAAMYRATKSFTGKDFYEKIRKRPSRQLLYTLRQGLAGFDAAAAGLHRARCLKLAGVLAGRYRLPGPAALHHVYWVFPVLSTDVKKRIPYFRSEGFFLSSQQGICAFGGAQEELKNSRALVDEVVYLPVYPEVPDAEISRLEKMLLQ